MARNSNPWFKFYPRDWLESERIMDMSLAAEGLYIRMIAIQATRGSLPADLQKLARIVQKSYDDIAKIWSEVAPHFSEETVDGEARFYNCKQREEIKTAIRKFNNNSKASKLKARYQSVPDLSPVGTESVPDPHPIGCIRASVSDSDSVSASVSNNIKTKEAKDYLGYGDSGFCEFMDLWPRKIQRKQAFAAYQKNVTTDALRESLVAKSKQAIAGIFKNREVDKIPYPATWLNGSDWQDNGADLSATPQLPRRQNQQNDYSGGADYNILDPSNRRSWE